MNNLHNIEELPPLEVHSKWRLPLNYILDVVAAEYRVQVPLIKSPRRDGDVRNARNAFYLLGRLFGHPWQALSDAVNRDNHTTPMSGAETARTLFWEKDSELERYVSIITQLANACRLLGKTERATEAARSVTTKEHLD